MALTMIDPFFEHYFGIYVLQLRSKTGSDTHTLAYFAHNGMPKQFSTIWLDYLKFAGVIGA